MHRSIAISLGLGLVAVAASVATAPARAGDANYLKKGSVGTIKIESDRSDEVEILIRAVNDSEELKTKRHKLGNRVWVDEGVHTVSVVCEISTDRGLLIKNGEIEVEARDGETYLLILDDEQAEDDRTCFLRAVTA